MLDQRLRPTTNALLAAPARALRVAPSSLTASGLVVGLGAAFAAGQRWWLVALLGFAINRLLDGLDGVVSRQRGTSSDAGAYFDIVADAVVFAVIPLGCAFGHDSKPVWVATALLLGSFALNLISWSHLSALLERRQVGASSTGELTSVTMPSGLVEGAETVVWFALFLAVPSWIEVSMLTMAAAVTVGALLRARNGMRLLDRLAAQRADAVGAFDG